MDFTSGNRDLGQEIIQYYNNVFTGSVDDILDLDGTDAWIEGNIFLHAHLGPVHTVAGTASAISGGNNGTDTSQITMIGNIFYDCDNVAQAKQGNFYVLLNNTVVHQNHLAGNDTDGASFTGPQTGRRRGRGMFLEGNIIYGRQIGPRQPSSIVAFSTGLSLRRVDWSRWRQFNQLAVAQIHSAAFRNRFPNLGSGPGHARLVQFVARLTRTRHWPQRPRQRRRHSNRRIHLRRADWH
jgi:hypothetical protein